MPRKKWQAMPLPSPGEMDNAYEKKREIVACSGANRGQELFLKLAFRTGDMGVVYVDPINADRLFRLLKTFLPNSGENDGSPTTWAADELTDAQGHLLGDDWNE